MLESSYICPNCGEEIVVPVDVSQGPTQEYVEDCPVCCSPVVLQISIFGENASIEATAE